MSAQMSNKTFTICLVGLAVVIAACGGVRADDVVVGDLEYRSVAIVDVDDCHIVFRVFADVKLSKPIYQVTRVTLTNAPAFNRAEVFASARRWNAAVAAYDVAECEMGDSWLGRLLRGRQLIATARAGRVGWATQLWLEMMDANPSSPVVLGLRPSVVDPANQVGIARAIDLLTARRKTISAENKEYLAAIDVLLAELNRNHNPARAGNPARLPRRKTLPETRSQVIAIMDEATRLANPPTDDGAVASDQQLCLAGLEYMKVASLHPDSPLAAEALRQAGLINTKLGNQAAASVAYQAVVRRYPSSQAAEDVRQQLTSQKKSVQNKDNK